MITNSKKLREEQIFDLKDLKPNSYYFVEEQPDKNNNQKILEVMLVTHVNVKTDYWEGKTIHNFSTIETSSDWGYDKSVFENFSVYKININDYPELLL